MKSKNEFKVNISIMESMYRLLLILPAGMFGVYAAVMMNSYIFMLLPFYLLVTSLTYYSPVKQLYTSLIHRSLFKTRHSHEFTSI